MKDLIKIFSTILLISMASVSIFFTACGGGGEHTIHLEETLSTTYVLLDYTEGQEYEVDFEILYGYNKASEIILLPIVNQAFSPFERVSMKADKGHSGNSLMEARAEKNAIAAGKILFDKVITEFNSEHTGTELKNSSIVDPVTDTYSKTKPGDLLVVFSDFLENYNNVNYRNLTPEDITGHLCPRVKGGGADVILVTEVFREKDAIHMKKALPSWENCLNNVTLTTTL